MTLSVTTPPVVFPVSLAEVKAHIRVDSSDEDTLITALTSAATDQIEQATGRAFVVRTLAMTFNAFVNPLVLPTVPLAQVTSITYIDTDGDTQTLATSVYDVDTAREPGLVRLAFNQSFPSTRSVADAVTVNYVVGSGASFTAAESTDVLTVAGRTFEDADIVRLSATDGDLPTGLAELTDYHVRDVSGQTLKLAATAGGTAIDFTTDGTSTQFIGVIPATARAAIKLTIAHWHEHREAVTDGRPPTEVPMAARFLMAHNWLRPIG